MSAASVKPNLIQGPSCGQREQGTYAKEFYTNVKTAYTD